MNSPIFNFNTDSDLSQWFIVNDGVMGGVSESSLIINEEGHGLFSGKVRLENNGGFASVRHNFNPVKVSEKTAIQIKLKGDGKIYQFRVKDKFDTFYSYVINMQTTGKWETISILLKDMKPQFRGRKLNMANFDREYISEIAILIGNKKKESFNLQIDSINLKN